MKRIGRYTALFLTLFFSGYALLLLAGLIPTSTLMNNIRLSASQLSAEGYRNDLLIQRDETYQLDNFTETRILLESVYMDTKQAPQAVLINPTYEGNDEPIETMQAIVENEALLPADTYLVQNVLGARAVVRTLLAFMNLRQIRRLIMWVVMLLFAANMIQLRRQFSALISLLFAVSFLAVNPIAVMSSMQYSCCFIIALSAMLAVSYLHKWNYTAPMLFFIIGGVTQYFDLYTVPLLTFGMPMIVLLLIRQQQGQYLSFKESAIFVGQCFGAWFACYGLMWLGKLLLTNLLTDFSGWGTGFAALYKVVAAAFADRFTAVWLAIANLATIESALCVVAFFIVWPFLLDLRPQRKAGWNQGWIFLLIAAMPIVWTFIAAGSMMHNAYYEYRVMCMLLFGVFCFYAKPTQYLEKYRAGRV